MGASQDRFVKAPLSRLWFDGSFRWHRKPGATIVRIAGGRLFVRDTNLYAIDVYTGRHLWQRDVSSLDRSEDKMVAVPDAVYLASGKSCVVLNPVNGENIHEIGLPVDVTESWSILRVTGDSLIAACGIPIVCVNRHSGDLIWKHDRQAEAGCLVLGNGKVFCSDFVATPRGEKKPDVPIEALDIQTGKVLWQTTGGSQVRYCESSDVLCTTNGVFRGSDGTLVNKAAISMVAGNKLISGGADHVTIWDSQTGETSRDGQKWNRRGCTILRGGSNLLTTRFMGNAAYMDIATGKITSIWNVRAACSNNLFPANGVLNIPDLSGGCTCNYMPISQAFVPARLVEYR
jgi:outer membrane protein assembly factor BamB